MAKSFQRHDLFSCELGLENDDHDDNNDKNVDIKIGSLDDFEVLVFFGISENAFKEHNGRIDGQFITCLWLRPAVYQKLFPQGQDITYHLTFFYVLVFDIFP